MAGKYNTPLTGKLVVFSLYSDRPGISRQGNSVRVEKECLRVFLQRSKAAEVLQKLKAMETLGYIYNLEYDALYYYYKVKTPLGYMSIEEQTIETSGGTMQVCKLNQGDNNEG